MPRCLLHDRQTGTVTPCGYLRKIYWCWGINLHIGFTGLQKPHYSRVGIEMLPVGLLSANIIADDTGISAD